VDLADALTRVVEDRNERKRLVRLGAVCFGD